ncbi:vanadium-dependent haloperoxidase [Marinimicrobium sp. ABcell2]|uniref:vanadium-dependent haloperoxidase n=1 Tax=Marinimicrobium sp. ABcell2 TaxID=3069751 RepID=UPI0027B2C754|nr:vanadium-dependent haloperoxidase [Marinimicrobium sp. ABcell2]MDQ2077942.1 vanadium-dependent haloperoxidase [Marinimicrobium sp. ABcell2]
MPLFTLKSTVRVLATLPFWGAIGLVSAPLPAHADHHLTPFPEYDPTQSVARNWNEATLAAISRDFARPTVHARNLFHTAIAMYDTWAIYDDNADTYLLAKTHAETDCRLTWEQRETLLDNATDQQAARETALSYAVFRVLEHRFANSPGAEESIEGIRTMFSAMDHDRNFTSTDLSTGSGAALGNYLADCIIEFGLADGANEQADYANSGYEPVNGSLNPVEPGVHGIVDPNRWQPLSLDITIDQSGNETDTPTFLGANWGDVTPFALQPEDRTVYTRDGVDYAVYHDPGEPALLGSSYSDAYKWNHLLVSIWSSHLDPSDEVMWDVSPGTIGNTGPLPTTIDELNSFYEDDGSSLGQGHAINPVTGMPYEEQRVPRGDYTRVLAEFWADGPNSYTPPGHWFEILNKAVNDHPQFEKRFMGVGPVLDDLEWDVKAYFALSGALHDAAIAAWSIKGWYDYIRPVSAIRYMGSMGQSSDPNLPNYHIDGVTLKEGYVELVEEGDPLAGEDNEHVGKVKLFAWRGPDYIQDPETDMAGVGWILAENWWPYQRPTFVTPPFAGYISGHSTFSRAAAELLTIITGDEYFPGGMGEFVARQNEYLVFEQGPSVDVVLQWATYRDASDQTSLSRIWGGIHPPLDDIPGRLIGIRVGESAFAQAEALFAGPPTLTEPTPDSSGSDSGGDTPGYDRAGGGKSSKRGGSLSPAGFVLFSALVTLAGYRQRRLKRLYAPTPLRGFLRVRS